MLPLTQRAQCTLSAFDLYTPLPFFFNHKTKVICRQWLFKSAHLLMLWVMTVSIHMLNTIFGLMHTIAVARKMKVDLNWPKSSYSLWNTNFFNSSWNQKEVWAFFSTPGWSQTCNKEGRMFKYWLEAAKMWRKKMRKLMEEKWKKFFQVSVKSKCLILCHYKK